MSRGDGDGDGGDGGDDDDDDGGDDGDGDARSRRAPDALPTHSRALPSAPDLWRARARTRQRVDDDPDRARVRARVLMGNAFTVYETCVSSNHDRSSCPGYSAKDRLVCANSEPCLAASAHNHPLGGRSRASRIHGRITRARDFARREGVHAR